jgi:starch synthase
VLAASSPDEKSIGDEVAGAVEKLKSTRGSNVIWIEQQVSKSELIVLLSHAAVFACPSIYEPLGIVNLEAMACSTPVVASAVGGIPEVVVPGETGLLVDYTPNDIASFEEAFVAGLNQVLENPSAATAMGVAGRKRATESFDWSAIARSTIEIYKSVQK